MNRTGAGCAFIGMLVIGGAYMLFVAVFSMMFGTVVDRHRKHRVMLVSRPVRGLSPNSRRRRG